jgi:hypothetical protein
VPYHLGKSASCPASKPHAVLKEDGTVVSGGCHATRAEALKHQRALTVNVEDAQVDRNFVRMMDEADRPQDSRGDLAATVELAKRLRG